MNTYKQNDGNALVIIVTTLALVFSTAAFAETDKESQAQLQSEYEKALEASKSDRRSASGSLAESTSRRQQDHAAGRQRHLIAESATQ